MYVCMSELEGCLHFYPLSGLSESRPSGVSPHALTCPGWNSMILPRSDSDLVTPPHLFQLLSSVPAVTELLIFLPSGTSDQCYTVMNNLLKTDPYSSLSTPTKGWCKDKYSNECKVLRYCSDGGYISTTKQSVPVSFKIFRPIYIKKGN